jgi:tRNA pseudouridine38-40 synthase
MNVAGQTGTRYRAVIEYDGTAYYGFQRQVPEQPTIQGQIEQALRQIAHRPVTITGAGRTDSGVHALGQVISFDLAWTHGPAALLRAINANLPPDIAILALDEAAPTFHPRYDARRRTYHYYIYNRPLRSPLRRQTSWHVVHPLNIDTMNQAAKALVGVHDFATFGQPPKGENSVRQVYLAHWQPHNEFLVFTIEANAFLYRMVRSLVGSMKAVGDGSWTVSAFVAAFQARDRRQAGDTAPPHGLYLVSITYDDAETR